MKELPKKYNHQETESRWQKQWLESGTYQWDSTLPRNANYVIDTPPPTVSGLLHMGHVFSYTQADFIARWQRMNGMNVFYPMGFDDNGLPTERLVEKVKKKRAVDYPSREAFIEACEGVAEEARRDFRALFQSIALSVDWNFEYHTISERSRKLAQLSFLDLYRKGKVERRLEPMLWDPVDQTAIAQAEVEDKEVASHFCDIRFAIANDDSKEETRNHESSNHRIIVATTRPELIPACVAIFYHPEDERYQHLKGKHAITPLFGVKVPILEDDTVEMDKGTGIMMCCTFGDEADIEKWRKHKLPMRQVLNKYGKMEFDDSMIRDFDDSKRNELVEALSGLRASHHDAGFNNDPTKSARAKTIELLRESGELIEAKPITHAVKCAERSGAPLEILTTQQWFVDIMSQKEELLARSRSCNWHPEWMAKRMEQWIEGLSMDWCISRQRYYGVPFPVWFSKRAGEEGKVIFASPDQLPCNPLVDLPEGYSKDEVEPEADVLDTWFTSSISPQLSSGGIGPTSSLHGSSGQSTCPPKLEERRGMDHPDKPGDDGFILNPELHEKLYPADMRPQAHEIIRTWAFYTLVKSHYHADCEPWKNLMISGWCLAEDKQKMSKSKGNVVTPIDLIETNGSDVVRYWASTSKLGQDTAYSPDLLKIGKKLVTKLWNATKFAAIHLEKLDESAECEVLSVEQQTNNTQHITATLDRWILTRLHRTVAKATEAFETYEYAAALRAMEDFFWNDFCDNYLELVKKRAYGEEELGNRNEDLEKDSTKSQILNAKSSQLSAVYTIHHCLDAILRLFAPILPHVTEELWSHIFDAKHAATGSIHARGNWPKAADYPVDETAEALGITVVELLEEVRKAKSDEGVSIKRPFSECVITRSLDDSAEEDFKAAANIERIVTQATDKTDAPLLKSYVLAVESDAA